MPRQPNPQIKADLLQRATHYVLEHGLSDLSLRPLAAHLGINARTLLYHFGSKEELVIAVLDSITQHQQVLLASSPVLPADPSERLEILWAQLTSPELLPFLRSLFEVELQAIDGEPHFREYTREALASWLELVRSYLRDASTPNANFVLAAFTGLLIDRFSTGDAERTDAAFRALVEALRKGELV